MKVQPQAQVKEEKKIYRPKLIQPKVVADSQPSAKEEIKTEGTNNLDVANLVRFTNKELLTYHFDEAGVFTEHEKVFVVMLNE